MCRKERRKNNKNKNRSPHCSSRNKCSREKEGVQVDVNTTDKLRPNCKAYSSLGTGIIIYFKLKHIN